MGEERFKHVSKMGFVKKISIEMGKPIFFSKLIIITCLIPIFAFQKVEGKMFSPLAYTLGFALAGALLFTLTLVPALASILLRKNVKEKHNVIVSFFEKNIERLFRLTYKNKLVSVGIALAVMAVTF